MRVAFLSVLKTLAKYMCFVRMCEVQAQAMAVVIIPLQQPRWAW